jgi:hypothetical protein
MEDIMTKRLTLKDFIVAPSVLLSAVSCVLAFKSLDLKWFVPMLIFALIAKFYKGYFDQFDVRGLSGSTVRRALGSRGGDKA